MTDLKKVFTAQGAVAGLLADFQDSHGLADLEMIQAVRVWETTVLNHLLHQERSLAESRKSFHESMRTWTGKVEPEPSKVEVALDDKDLRCEVYVCGVSRLTRVTHIPTGLYGTCPGNDMLARGVAEDELKRKLAAK